MADLTAGHRMLRLRTQTCREGQAVGESLDDPLRQCVLHLCRPYIWTPWAAAEQCGCDPVERGGVMGLQWWLYRLWRPFKRKVE
jgi:hypothetical protein